MGDSTCLMPPFSYTSGVSNEAYQGNAVHALGESVSFGRFMTESLAWEKWSSFSQKRHVEEAARYAQPGSVAQKKAFFEAHYKRIADAKKAAALLEQENAVFNATEPEVETADPGDCNNGNHDSETINEDSKVVPEIQQEMEVGEGLNVNENSEKLEIGRLENDSASEPEVLVEISPNVDNRNMVPGSGTISTTKIEKPLLKNHNSIKKDISRSASKKRPVISTARSTIFSKVAFSPATVSPKYVAPLHSRKENSFTPRTIKSTIKSKICSMDLRRATPKSLRKSIDFTTATEPDKLSTLATRKRESSIIVPNTYKASKDLVTPLRTPAAASVNGKPRPPSVTPRSVNKSCSKSLSSSQIKVQSSTLSTPFILNTELRAAKRKQRLEERFNEKEADKVQMQTNLKERAEAEARKLRQSLCFRARPLPEFYRERASSNNHTNQNPEMQSQTPKLGRKSFYSTAQGTNTLPSSSTKNNAFKNISKKISLTPARNVSLPATTPRSVPSTSKKLSTDHQKQ